MNTASRYEPLAPRQEQFTTWHNPCDHEQKVDVFYGTNGHMNEPRATRFVFPPHASVDVPSRFDQAIQRVQCQEEECRRVQPGFCRKPHEHPGTVLGGLAPQLRRDGSKAQLAPALDPTLAEKKQREAEIAAANIAKRDAENAMLVAEARRRELEDAAAAAKAEPARPAAPAPQKK